MGKKSRKQQQQHKSDAQKVKLCSSLSDKGVCKLVEELWNKTSNWSGGSSVIPPPAALWEDYETIRGIIDALQQRQGPSPLPLPPRQESYGDFLSWMSHEGAKFDKLEIDEFPEVGCGLRVRETIEEEEKAIVVPETLIITKNIISKTPLLAFISQDPLLNAMPNLALAMILLNERYNSDSFWRPYINVLPQEFDLPLFYSREELQELHGSPVLLEAVSQLRNISRLYSIIHQQLRSHSDPHLLLCTVGFHYADFVWAVSCVMSRQNKIPSKKHNEEPLLALIPLWDMANHNTGRILTDFDVDTRSCVCYSMSKYSPGEEFRIFYGERGNSDLLLNQGFAYKGNPYDIVKIPIGLSRGEEEVTRKMRMSLLDRIKLKVPGQFPVRSGLTPFSPELIGFTRVFTASLELLKEWMELKDDKELQKTLTSDKLEYRDIKALEFLQNRCLLLLHPYKTSLEEDEAILKHGSLRGRVRNILILRISEKRILKNATQLAGQEKEKLQKSEEKEGDKHGMSKEDLTKLPSEVEDTNREEGHEEEKESPEQDIINPFSKMEDTSNEPTQSHDLD